MGVQVKILPSAKGMLSAFAKAEVERRGKKVLAEAKRTCPTDSGQLRDSLRLDIAYKGMMPYATVGSPLEYAIYVHQGTGIYVGRGYIRPKRAQVLAWPARANSYNVRNGMVFAAKVRGMRGRPWLVNALRHAGD